MQKLNVIGVAGQRRAGKDSLADCLAPLFGGRKMIDLRSSETYTTHWGRGSFASEVKRIFCETFMFDPTLIDEWKVKDEPPPGFDKAVREGLTTIGDGFREIMGDIWIRRAFRDETCLRKVYSDIRYLNEGKKVHEVGGPNILICHPDRINYLANRSESELRPYILWCNDTGREGPIKAWPEFHALCQEDGRDGYMHFPFHDKADYLRFLGQSTHDPIPDFISISTEDFIKNLSIFDVFIRNQGTLEDLYEKARVLVVPWINGHYHLEAA